MQRAGNPTRTPLLQLIFWTDYDYRGLPDTETGSIGYQNLAIGITLSALTIYNNLDK